MLQVDYRPSIRASSRARHTGQILARLDTPAPASPAAVAPISGYITAKEFMDATRIKRTKFNSLVLSNKIKTIKKSRKVLVPASEVQRYFTDPSIQ